MSVRKRNRSWVADWTDSTGKRRTRTFRTKREAQAWEQEQRRLARRGEFYDPVAAKRPLTSLYEPFIGTKQSLKAKSIATIHDSWVNVVQPRWGDVQLRHITLADVRGWIANCESVHGHQLSASSTRKAYGLLKMMLDFAVEQGSLVKNPAVPSNGSTRKLLPRVPTKGSEALLSREEVNALARSAAPYSDLIMLLATIGLRFNEAVALRGRDIDPEHDRIEICRTFSDVGGELIVQTPKNGKARVVPLPDQLRPALLARKLSAGSDGLIFQSPQGFPIRYNNFRRRIWGPALTASGIEHPLKIHDLRHTAASWLIQNNCSITLLSAMLGHADSSTTLRNYAHLFQEDVQRFGKMLNEIDSA
jgi:integrase